MFRLISLTVLLVYVHAKVDLTGHRLISIQAKNAVELEFLHNLQENMELRLDFWTGPSLVRPTDIHVPPASYSQLRRLLMEAGIQFQVKNENIQELIDTEARSMRGRSTTDPSENYFTYEQINSFVKDMANTHPDRVSWAYIGYSHEGKDLLEVKIAKSSGTQKKAIYIECGTHAREWLSVSTCLNLIKTLASKEGDAMVENYDWYIMPLHNPDGYEYTRTDNRVWRKNRQGVYDNWWYGECGGTDLNRNWDANHGAIRANHSKVNSPETLFTPLYERKDKSYILLGINAGDITTRQGSSSDKCTDTYHGGNPFSAPETLYLMEAIEAVRQKQELVAFFSIHCYSQLMLVPYGFTTEYPSDYNELKCVADKMMDALYAVNRKVFDVGTPPDLLYVASGGAFDWAKITGTKYSYTYELRPSGNLGYDGFIQPSSEIRPTADETIASLRAFADMDLSKPC